MNDTAKGVLFGAVFSAALIAVYARFVLPSAVDNAVRREVSMQLDATRGTVIGAFIEPQRSQLEPFIGNIASRVARTTILNSLPF